MSVTIVATPGASNANSYATEAEADAYFAARLPLPTPWDSVEDKTAALAMAARVLTMFAQATKVYIAANGSVAAHYVTRRTWTGAPSTTTQRLAWPRTGMYDINGNAIASDVVPQELKEAQAELAGLLAVSDTTLDNDVIVGGITSVTAGSVSLTFKDMIQKHVLPDSVWMLMPTSWFTDELYTPAMPALFDVVS